MALSVAVTAFGFGVPFRGSVWALMAISSAYLGVMLALGLLISTLAKNQFAASQAALIAGFLPAFELSGFIFEIDSMPAPIRLLASILPPRYFVSSMQTLFLAGDVPSVLVPNALVLLAMAAVLFAALVVARFEGSPNFREVVHLGGFDEIARTIDSRSALMVVHIRQDFSRSVGGKEGIGAAHPGWPQLQPICDPGRLRAADHERL